MAYHVQPAVTGSGLAGAGRPYTAQLWDGYDPAAMLRDPSLGHFDQVDFVSDVPVVATAQSVANFGEWNAFTAATAATCGPTAIQGGAISLTSATDDMEVYLQRGVIGSRPYALATTSEVTAWPYHHVARVRFEFRFALSTVVAETQGWFVGLAGVVADNDLDDGTTDVVTSKNFFGWSGLASTGGATSRFIYQAAADSAPQVLIANCGTLVANTWYTLGFDFNPMAKNTERCSIWKDGVKNVTYLTSAQAAASTFPKTVTGTAMVDLAPSFFRKNGATVAGAMYISGFRISQEFVVSQGNEACA